MTPPIRIVSVPVALLERMKEQLWEKPVRSDVTLVRKMIEDLLTAAPVREEGGAGLELIEAAKECLRLGRSTGEDTPENRQRARAQYRLNQLTTPKNIIAALATREEAPAEAGAGVSQADLSALERVIDVEYYAGSDGLGDSLKRILSALRAQPQARAWGWDYEICTGCSASLSLADIKAGGHVSCCPERRMVTVQALADAYEAQRKPQAREEAEPGIVKAICQHCQRATIVPAETLALATQPLAEGADAEKLRAILTQIDFNHDPGEPEGDGYRLIGPAIDQITEALAAPQQEGAK